MWPRFFRCVLALLQLLLLLLSPMILMQLWFVMAYTQICFPAVHIYRIPRCVSSVRALYRANKWFSRAHAWSAQQVATVQQKCVINIECDFRRNRRTQPHSQTIWKCAVEMDEPAWFIKSVQHPSSLLFSFSLNRIRVGPWPHFHI